MWFPFRVTAGVRKLAISVRIHQTFLRTVFVFFAKICRLECNTTSDWLNRTV